MVPKVSAALKKFVKPVSSSSTSLASDRQAVTAPQPEKKNSKDQDPHFQRESPPKVDDPAAVKVASQSALKNDNRPLPTGLTNAFLYLFQRFGFQREALTSWLARHSYEKASQNQKSTGKIRKGAVLDQKEES